MTPCIRRLIACALLAGSAGALSGQSARLLEGVVRDQAGNAVAGAEVRSAAADVRSVTDANGAFRLQVGTGDSARISVRRLGFKPQELAVALSSTAPLVVRLEAAPLRLATVNVSTRPEVFDARLNGFYSRSKKGTGTFITRETLDRLSTGKLTDALREVPGVRVGQTQSRGQGPRSVRLRGASCAPTVFLDGFPATAGEFDLDMVDPWTVEGIEVYHGLASVPAELLAPGGGERCGVVAIWSRPYRPPRRQQRSGQDATVTELVAGNRVFTADQVDIAADLKQGTATAVYPDSLFEAAVPGRVLIEFVIDTTGSVEPGTIGVVASTHPDFSTAAINALRDAEFRPALKDGRRVRQAAQLPFVFARGEARPKP